jgi:hypothetical protein
VIPFLNTVLVTTGGNFEYSDIEKWLLPALVDSIIPKPADPDGEAVLKAALSTIQQGESGKMSNILPETAQAVSGRKYSCESSPIGLENFILDFDNPKLASLRMNVSGMSLFWQIGMNGDYYQVPEGEAIRGYWEDEKTFVLQIFDIGVLTREITFTGDNSQVGIPEAGIVIDCQAENP